jgi:hypothetical protein
MHTEKGNGKITFLILVCKNFNADDAFYPFAKLLNRCFLTVFGKVQKTLFL